MDPSKLESMSKWPIPTKKKEVQAFLVFANYYCGFIVNYSAKPCPLINLTKDVSFTCEYAHSKLLTNFKDNSSLLTSSPNLIEPSRQSWKPMQAIKQLLVSCLNTTSSMDASNFIQLSNTQQPSPLYNVTGQSMIRNYSLLWTVSGSGETG